MIKYSLVTDVACSMLKLKSCMLVGHFKIVDGLD